MKNAKVILMVMAFLSLTACGRIDYTGRYVGSASAGATQGGSMPMYNGYSGYGGYGGAGTQVQLDLTQNGSSLAGTLTANGASGNVIGTVDGKSINNVTINTYQSSNINMGSPTSNYSMGGAWTCYGPMTGGLNGSDGAQTITGSLSASSCGGQMSFFLQRQ